VSFVNKCNARELRTVSYSNSVSETRDLTCRKPQWTFSSFRSYYHAIALLYRKPLWTFLLSFSKITM